MRPLLVIEQENIVVPRLQVWHTMGGAPVARVPAVAVLGVVALATHGARDSQHDVVVFLVTACKSSSPRRPHRVPHLDRILRGCSSDSMNVPRRERSCARSTNRRPVSP